MKIYKTGYENDNTEYWFFDSIFNLIKYENKWSGEGFKGILIQGFSGLSLEFEIDTTRDSNSMECTLVHSNMKSVKGINKYFEYDISMDNKRIIKQKISFLNDDYINIIQKRTYNNLLERISIIKQNKNYVKFQNGFAKIIKNNEKQISNDYYTGNITEFFIDSLLFINIIEGKLKY